ncbi:DUF3939 domain-containing protein [Bacillus sp. BRMEA1]|uniref:DUF3939 domain-containing protein n=1 Tax=Neobacillus endophyticus TaxID=2738405 RepID=UPI001565C7FC|nr:DUF3939 domain-containing protein [Neobacillus endophyticus]NRD78320.1 DUF3939 domain-containing protein [Neobacillus endophyticus]
MCFTCFQKYFKTSVEQTSDQENTFSAYQEIKETKEYPVIHVTIEDVRVAIREFSNQLPKGVYRTILVKEDYSVDTEQLVSILGGIPSINFYMSKETYDVFDETEKHIPAEMDTIQKAVDQYVKDHNRYPMLPFDPQRRVNYYQLLQGHYIKRAPELQFYITDLDGLITHICPKNTSSAP